MIIVDDGHHNVAPGWQAVFQRFPEARVISVTATPFRTDEQPIDGTVIYRYPFREAMRRGYIKEITASNVAPSQLRFSISGSEYTHTRSRKFSRCGKTTGIRKASRWRRSATSLLSTTRSSGSRRSARAGCATSSSQRRAQWTTPARSAASTRSAICGPAHSGQTNQVREEILRELPEGRLDVIVQVQLLGEGFDHPPLSIAAIFRPYRSLSPYIQFVGRIMRVNVPDAPGHDENQGIAISHVGLNLDRHWADFKQIDGDDQVTH